MQLTNLFADLTGQRITSKAAAPLRPDLNKQVVATYRNEAGALVAAAVCDISVGASLGAVLSMVPVERVDECMKQCRLDGVLRENLHEVFNVLSAAFPMSGSPRVILHAMRCPAEDATDTGTLLTSKNRLDLEIGVGGYRAGKLAIFAV